MKKIIFLFSVLLISVNSFSQCDSSKCCDLDFYSSVGISIGHVDKSDPGIDNFNKASYPSIEIGFMKNNFALGAVFGCENIFVSSNSREFYELKTSASHPIGNLSGYALFGVGSYFEKESSIFIEYGAGFSYTPCAVGYFVQYSNWATYNYISTGLTYNF